MVTILFNGSFLHSLISTMFPFAVMITKSLSFSSYFLLKASSSSLTLLSNSSIWSLNLPFLNSANLLLLITIFSPFNISLIS